MNRSDDFNYKIEAIESFFDEVKRNKEKNTDDLDAYNDREMADFVAEIFHDKWITGFDYFKAEPSVYVGGSFPALDKEKKHMAVATICYIQHLFNHSAQYTFSEMEEFNQEIAHYEREGGLCLYLTVLHYMLLIKFNVIEENRIKFIQGFYRHKLREDFPFHFGENHVGLHTWLTLDDAVLDIAIGQEEKFFDFQDQPYIVGRVPKGLDLVGFTEISKTPKKYARQFAKRANIKLDEWVNRHASLALEYTNELIKEEMS